MAESRPPDGPSLLTWLVPTCVLAVAIAFASPQVPPRARLLVLFPVGCGLVLGFVSGELARRNVPDRLWLVVSVTAVAAVLGVGGGTVVTYRDWAREVRAELRRDLERQRSESNGGLAGLVVGGEKRAFEEATSFPTYLVRRTTQLGRWPVWGAIAFWAAELLLAGAAAGVLAGRSQQRAPEDGAG